MSQHMNSDETRPNPTPSDEHQQGNNKRNRGGRPKNGADEFALFDERDPKKMRYMCCKDEMKSIVWNSKRALNHLMQFKRFRNLNPNGYEKLLKQHVGNDAASAEASRRSSESVTISPQRLLRVTTSESYTDKEKIDRFYSVVSSERKEKLDRAWSDVIINDALPFSLGSSSHWKSFWKLALEGAWKPPYRQTISGPLLDYSYEKNLKRVLAVIKHLPAVCMSVDGFTDVNSKSLFNVMAGGPLAFVGRTFRLEGRNESAINMDSEVSKAIIEANNAIGKSEKVLAFVSDSPNVMVATRRLLCGSENKGSNCVEFAYGCVCHSLSNLVKDLCNHKEVKDTLTRTVQLAQFFRNTHVARDLLDNVKRQMKDPPQTVKSYSTTRWNGVAVLFESVLDNKKPIGDVFTSQTMAAPSDRVFDLRPRSKITAIKHFATDGAYWESLQKLTPLFKLINIIVTFMEGDSVPISYVPLSFTLIYETVKTLNYSSLFIDHVRSSIRRLFSSIKCEVHSLALVLDPFIPRDRWHDVKFLFDREESLAMESRHAFKKISKWLSHSDQKGWR